MAVKFARPLHPGEFLQEEFLIPLELSAGQLARATNLPQLDIERLVAGQGAVSTDMAIRLGRFLKTSPEFWLNLQRAYDIEVARPSSDSDRAP